MAVNYYLLLYENAVSIKEVEPGQEAAIVKEYRGWLEATAEAGHVIRGEKFTNRRPRLTYDASDELVVADAGLNDGDEFIGGYFAIQASSYDEAVAISQSCPHLKYGGKIELREVDHKER